MEVFSFLADGIFLALQPVNLALILIGVTVGLFIGAMPGLGSVNGVAILLPITFLVPPWATLKPWQQTQYCPNRQWKFQKLRRN